MLDLPEPHFIACMACGDCVPYGEWKVGQHSCNEERWIRFQIIRQRPKIERFETDFADWLTTPLGQFELYYAQSRRLTQIANLGIFTERSRT